MKGSMLYTNIVSSHDAPALRDAGYRPLDTHLHSISYDQFPDPQIYPDALYQKMMMEGDWGFFVITDHDDITAYDALTNKEGAVRAAEIKIKPKQIRGEEDIHTLHVNVFDITREEFHKLEEMAQAGEFYDFKQYLDIRGIPYKLNHPSWHEPTEQPNWSALPDIIQEFNVIEAYNGGRTEAQNRIGLELARTYGKGVDSASDSHIGRPAYATWVKGEDFREAWDNIQNGRAYIVPQNMTLEKAIDELYTRIDQLAHSDSEALKTKRIAMGTGSPFYDAAISFILNGPIRIFPWLRKPEAYALRKIMQAELDGVSVAERLSRRAFLAPQLESVEKVQQDLAEIVEEHEQARAL